MFPIDVWSLLIPTVVFGTFVFTVLRQRDQWSLTLRVLGGVKLSRGAPRTCPHLGLTDDPFNHHDAPSEDHRCYLWMQRDRIDVTLQKGFCLSPAHGYCPALSAHPAVASVPLYRRVAASGAELMRRAATVYGPVLLARVHAGALYLAHAGVRGWAHLRRVWLPRLGASGQAAIAWASRQADLAEDLVRTGAIALRHRGAQGWEGLRAGLSRAAAWPGRQVDAAKQRWAERARTTAAPAPELPLHSSQLDAAVQPSLSQPALGQPDAQPSAPGALVSVRAEQLERLMEQGRLAEMAGDRRSAHAQFLQATQTAPDDEEAWLWCAATADDPQDKQTCLERALAINPLSTRARLLLEHLRGTTEPATAPAPVTAPSTLPPTPSPTPVPASAMSRPQRAATSLSVLLDRGVAELEAGREEAAYDWFVAATEAFPADGRAWFWRAKTAPDLTEVVSCLGQGLAADPDNRQLRAHYDWAMQRLERERQRERFGQALSAGAVPAVQAAARQPQAQAVASGPVARVRSGLSSALLRAAGVACLAFAAYWFLAALAASLPPDAVPLLGAAAKLVPAIPWETLPWPEPLQDLLPGYHLLSGLPHTLAFLALFAGLGLLNRQRWSPPWALALALVSAGLALAPGTPTPTVTLTTLLSALVALGWLTNRQAFSSSTAQAAHR